MSPAAYPVTVFLQSHYHTASAAVLAAIPVVLRGGHLRAATDYRVERRTSRGHDLLFCLAGAGLVRVNNRICRVTAGELAWINGFQPHAHWADPADPWELLWLRMDGAGLESLAGILGVAQQPVFRGLAISRVRAGFTAILKLMAQRPIDMEASLHVEVAKLCAVLWGARQTHGTEGPEHVSPAFERVLGQIRLYPQRAWTSAELAKLSGMSVPQFYRRFRQVTGASPIDWLRRERISLAKRRLLESTESIKAIAEQAGYNSPYFFSRDFKRYTGFAPTGFRRHEQGLGEDNERRAKTP